MKQIIQPAQADGPLPTPWSLASHPNPIDCHIDPPHLGRLQWAPPINRPD